MTKLKKIILTHTFKIPVFTMFMIWRESLAALGAKVHSVQLWPPENPKNQNGRQGVQRCLIGLLGPSINFFLMSNPNRWYNFRTSYYLCWVWGWDWDSDSFFRWFPTIIALLRGVTWVDSQVNSNKLNLKLYTQFLVRKVYRTIVFHL